MEPEPPGQQLFINNHIDVAGGAGAGVLYLEMIAGTPPSGVFLNNTILAGANPFAVPFRASAPSGQPAELRNNNLYGGASPYVASTGALGSVSDLNALTSAPLAGGNLRVDPQVGCNYHLRASSPNRGAGALTASGGATAPATDFESDPRPLPAATNPDIGPDERD